MLLMMITIVSFPCIITITTALPVSDILLNHTIQPRPSIVHFDDNDVDDNDDDDDGGGGGGVIDCYQ
jgi:hypothetical protein